MRVYLKSFSVAVVSPDLKLKIFQLKYCYTTRFFACIENFFSFHIHIL